MRRDTEERFRGPMAGLTRKSMPNMQPGFDEFAER